MADERRPPPETDRGERLAHEIGSRARRRRRGQRGRSSLWYGLALSGVIGWSVAVPTLAGALLGVWLDRRDPPGHGWTLALLVAGLVLGCAQAGYWVVRERQRMDAEDRDHD
ncbi:AtpZ/AtpI family protein [Salinisphaera sp. SPP-AMP-43]|uniref:AtpZ/AtpI family protein n=1 Tax=Salinisphaera sp. SPP-AMP-43 TaxID=3121288 RepID=UPI003C6DCFFB